MTSAWRTMEWVTSVLDVDSKPKTPQYHHHHPPDTIAGMIISDPGKAVAIGLAVVCLGIGLTYYITVYTAKLMGWFFRFMWKLSFALILTILLSLLVSLLLPWVWTGVAAMVGGDPTIPPLERGVADSSDLVYVYMSDGTLHPIPKWSEIGVRERVRRQAESQWGFLDRILGFKPWGEARGGGFWGTLLGFNDDPLGEWDTPHIAKSFISPNPSDMAWGGTKLAAQVVASACVSIGRGAVTWIADAVATLSEERSENH